MNSLINPNYEELQKIYSKYYSLGCLDVDINTKFALISLVCYLVHKLKRKKPDVTYYQVIKKIIGENISEEYIKGLSIVCSDFGYCCTSFPTFGIEDKKIPAKIKEILLNWLPF